MKTHFFKFILLGFVIFVSCKKESIDAIPDNEKLAQLKADIETFAKNKACSNGNNCRVLGIGAKPCGGPSGFIIYSLTNTDEKQLITKVNEYTDFQRAYNDKNKLVSDCSLLQIPTVDCINGVCSPK